jgi:hypothetical protein
MAFDRHTLLNRLGAILGSLRLMRCEAVSAGLCGEALSIVDEHVERSARIIQEIAQMVSDREGDD